MRGTWIYTTPVLSVYDRLVPGLLNRAIWRCPTGRLIDQYRNLVGAVHVDLGTGTGFFLKQIATDHSFHRLILVDGNRNSLRHAKRALRESNPETIQANLTENDVIRQIPIDRAESISASYLVHCLPRGLSDSGPIVDAAARLAGKNGVFFGSTILPELTNQAGLPRRCNRLFNRLGIFGNRHDSGEALDALLHKYFENVDLERVGCVALFRADNRIGSVEQS